MQYILTAGWEDGVADLTERLVRELAGGKRVLWLTSGGSNVLPTVQVMDNIPLALSKNLTILPADERYDKDPDHAESNLAQHLKAGFNAEQATLLPVLQTGLSLEQTVDRYRQLAEQALNSSDIVIAQLGIGPDGHIAGIMIDSPAAHENTALVVGYPDPPLTRMTLTFPGLRRIDTAYVFAFGKPKQRTLKTLETEALAPSEQPAQILKQLPEAYVYSDQVGEHV
jgi:6-phosphogluconolactonase/glucosamine-6-phosphate isomerase/deaminase